MYVDIVISNAFILNKLFSFSLLPMTAGGGDQSIGSEVSDVIVRSWLWSTATKLRVSHWATSVDYCK